MIESNRFDDDWNQDGGDARHSSIRLDREGPRRVAEAWAVDLPAAAGAPICDRDTVYVGTSRGDWYALDAETGGRRWVIETAGGTAAAPVIAGDTLSVASADGTVRAVDSATGDPRWETTLPGDLAGAPAAADGRLYVGHADGLSALDADTGEIRWTRETEGTLVGAPAVADDRAWSGPRVYAATDGETVIALDADAGDDRWTAPTSGGPAGAPTVVDDRVYVADDEGRLLALDADSGQTWFAYRSDDAFTSGVTVLPGELFALDEAPRADVDGDGTTFVGAADGYVHVTDTTVGRRKVRGWLFSKKGLALDGEVRASPVVVGDVVCVADTTGSIYGIDADEFDHWWHVAVDDAVTTTPAVGDARLFVGAGERLHCLEWTPGDQPSA